LVLAHNRHGNIGRSAADPTAFRNALLFIACLSFACDPILLNIDFAFPEQFDRGLPVLAADAQRLQMVASIYVRGMAFERHINGLLAFEGRMEIAPDNIK
jgi:hypothetical protein